MSDLMNAIIAAKLMGNGGGGGGGGLPEAYNYVIVASDFEALSENQCQFLLSAIDGWIMGEYTVHTDAETGDIYLTYDFYPDPYEEGNIPPSFWGNGSANIQAGLAYLLDLKLDAGKNRTDALAPKLCDPNSNMCVFGFTL